MSCFSSLDRQATSRREGTHTHTYICVDNLSDAHVKNAFTCAPYTSRFILRKAEDASSEEWDAVIGSNIKGYALTIKHAIRVMKTNQAPQAGGASVRPAGGAIVNLGSTSSFIGQPGLCTYSTTKAAIIALTR